MRMRSESMTAEERFWASVHLEKTDRVFVAPVVDTAAACSLLGLKSWEVVAQGIDAQLDTILRLFDEYGGWDGLNPPAPPQLYALGGTRVKFPSKESPENQIVEDELWTADEYEDLIDLGMAGFMTDRLITRIDPNLDTAGMQALVGDLHAMLMRFFQECKCRGAFPWASTAAVHPFFWLSLTRSMLSFTKDIYQRPDTVLRALDRIVPEWIETAIAFCKALGLKTYYFSEERAGAFFFRLDIFEKFWWPYTLQIVDALLSEGITPIFHLDTPWDKNLSYFKQLPKASVVLDFDGTTDIFAAAELLGGHLCIATDVHPALLSTGTPDDVAGYCRKLIDEVGRNGGMILQAGCSVPYAVKPDNFRIMIETGKKYGLPQ